jgi:hypothetical protein
MTDFEEPPADDRWLDQFLGDPAGDATREEVLDALRGHVLGTVVIEEENPGGTTATHVQGCLVEASRDPDTRETAELFSVVGSDAANAWHNSGPQWEEFASRPDAPPYLRKCLDAAKQPALFTFGIPGTGITQYLGADAGASGYRFAREDGGALAVVLWQDVMHITDSGDLAPGMGDFTITLTDGGETGE